MRKDPKTGEYDTFDKNSERLYKIELVIDIIICIDIVLNFLKKSIAATRLSTIAKNYLSSYFIFDIAPVIICLSQNESIHVYGFKLIRLVHLKRLIDPLNLMLIYPLSSFSKKR